MRARTARGPNSGASRQRSCRRYSSQLIEQRLSLFEIAGVETFGEPAIDRCEQITCCGAPALLAPQPGKARRGAQFVGSRLLPACDTQRLLEGVLALI